jgi:hypothetical protein
MTHYGIDLSSNNPHPIDYRAVVGHLTQMGREVPFAIIKATEATGYVNPFFMTDVQGIRAAGGAVAAYLFDHGQADPIAEQGFFRRVAVNLPEAWDTEDPQGLSNRMYADHINRGLQGSPASSLIYLNYDQFVHLPGAPWGHGLWLAQWNGDKNASVGCLIHQWSDQGNVPGIGSGVDMNRWEGTEAQFQSYFGGTSAPPPSLPVLRLNPHVYNPFVVRLQKDLNMQGANPALRTDGFFGDKTFAAVEEFQTREGISVDGVVGPQTWGALEG